MKFLAGMSLVMMFVLPSLVTAQSTYLVWTNGGNNPPYDTWADAATDIQTAVDVAVAGDTVLVTNGIYSLSTQIELTQAITLRSVYGPEVTIVDAGGVSGRRVISNTAATISGFTLQRGWPGNDRMGGCVWMSGGILTNCVIQQGYTYSSGSAAGGAGVYLAGGLVTHCTLWSNNANSGQSGRYSWGGGGIYMGGGILENSRIESNTCNGAGNWGAGAPYCAGSGVRLTNGIVRNCLIRNNTATEIYGYGGGVGVSGNGLVLNCTIVANSAQTSAGGVSSIRVAGGAVSNCIIYNNTCFEPGQPKDVDEPGIAAYSCSPDLTNGVNGNIATDPLFRDGASGDFRLSLASPCRNSGTNVAEVGALDLDEGQRINVGDGVGRVDMGCYEVGVAGSLTCDFSGSPSAGTAPVQVVLIATVLGTNTNGLYYWWDWDNNGSVDAEGFGQQGVTNVFAAGLYSVKLTVSNELGTVTNRIRSGYILSAPTTLYVATNGNHVAPFMSWGDAATNLVDALALQVDGGMVLISNGTYALTNEWTLDRGVTVRGFSGPVSTVVQRVGTSYYRLFALTHSNAVLDGLTLQNGRRPSYGYGANVWMNTGLLTNCIVRNGEIYRYGGAGVFMSGGLVTHSVITNNVQTADQSGRYSVGGGGVLIEGGILQNSLIAYNTNNGGGDTTPLGGGGIRARGGLVRNCLIRNNSTTDIRGYGGGVGVSGTGVILNCTIVDNSADASAGGVSSVKIAGGYVTNCVIYNNTCPAAGQPDDVDEPGMVWFSCSPDLTNGVNNNLTGAPLFADAGGGDFRLTLASPCKNAGTNVTAAGPIDLDDGDRIETGDGVAIIDMGAYEVGISSELTCDFSGDPVAGPAPLEVVFNATVLGPNTNGLYYRWDFDNNGSPDDEGSGKEEVTNTFAAGLYTVTLIVSNEIGTVTNQTRTDYILSVPSIIYVATNGGSVIPYDTWGKAATNLNEAAAIQQSGGTILVSNGVHTVTAEVTLAKGITVQGLNGWSNTVIQRESGAYRLFSLVHSNATLDGLTLTGGAPGIGLNGGCVWMSGGRVTNCVVRNGYTYRGGGSGIFMTGGLVTHCIITNNQGDADQSGRYALGGGGVYISGGVLEYSQILSNRCNGANDTQPLAGGGVRSVGGVVRNCLIQGNNATESRGFGGGVGVSSGGLIVNCTIVENNAAASAGGVSSIRVAGGHVTNCIIYHNTCVDGGQPVDIDEPAIAAYSCSPDLMAGVNNNLSADPLLADRASGNYRLSKQSPCKDVGFNLPGMTGSGDLDGNPRIRSQVVDLGAYEAPPSVTGILIEVR